MIDVLIWYGIAWLLGLLALPVCFLVFPRLPDRGYSFSKPVGLLLVGLLAWWVGNLGLPFVPLSCWLVVVALGLIGNLLLLFNRRLSDEMRDWFSQRHNLKLILTAELVFLTAFVFIINMRSFFPQLNQSEKFFDLAFINAIASSPSLPAPDPWFGGQPMNYYYGGQFLMGLLCKLSGTEVPTAYNIAMGLVYALATIGCFGLASNLVGLARRKSEANLTEKASIRMGLLGATFLMLLGNLAPLRQVLRDGIVAFGSPDFPFKVGWPASARMIYDPMPDGKLLDILTEYPIYSYLNGDLHAHLLGAPYLLLVLGFVLHLFVAPGKWGLIGPNWRGLPRLLAGGLILGAPYFINAGDFPTLLALTVGTLLLVESRAGGGWQAVVGRWGLQLVGLGIALWLVYFWYLTSFTGMLRGEPIEEIADVPLIGFFSRFVGWISWSRTNLMEYLLMFGLFLLPILTFYGLKIARLWQEEKQPNLQSLDTTARNGVRLIGLAFGGLSGLGLWRIVADLSQRNLSLTSLVIALIAGPLTLVTLWPGVWEVVRGRPRLAIEAMLGLGLLAVGPLLQFELLGPGLSLTYLSLRLAWRERREADWPSRLDSLAMLLVAFAGAITLFCELFYVRDIYANRFNTMFKFWYQLWVLFGLAGVYTTWRVISWARIAQVDEVPGPERAGSRFSLRPAWALLARRRGALARLSALLAPLQFRRRSLAEGPELKPDWNYRSGQSATVLPTADSSAHSEAIGTATRVQGNWWRRVWIGALIGLMLAASAVPTLGYWQETHGYTNRVGLDGEQWYAAEFPTEYPAMRWLREYTRNDPARRGVVLELNGMNYSWADRISTYTGLPTIVGWPFHELQWRAHLDEKIIWEAWLDMGRIYETTDSAKAIELLKQHSVRYVFVGQVENGTRGLLGDGSDYKNFAPEALAKFATFMKPIYSDPDNHIFIYAFE